MNDEIRFSEAFKVAIVSPGFPLRVRFLFVVDSVAGT
jgi:hypothetical protein